MSERSKYLTVIVSEPTQDEASALIGHPKMSAASWSHAIDDRDAKDAEIAELRAKLAASEASDAESISMFRKARDERDEARAELEEWNALGTAVIYGGVPARDTPTLWPNPWRQTIAMVAWAHHDIAGQRDEARECVRRLCVALRSIRDATHKPAITLRGLADHAIAATPEHLRS